MHEGLRPIPGYPNYSITPDGRIWSDPRPGSRGGWMSPPRGSHGYRTVRLGVAGRFRTLTVHFLVALTFHGPRPEGMEIRHLNGNPLDNRAENLAYGTQGQNMLDRVRHGTHHEAIKTHCPRGHAYDAANTYQYGRGRRCKTCELAAAKARRKNK